MKFFKVTHANRIFAGSTFPEHETRSTAETVCLKTHSGGYIDFKRSEVEQVEHPDLMQFLIDTAHRGLNKRNLGEILGLKTFDTAYPIQWADKVREIGLNPSWCVICYDEPATYGKPVDLLHLLFEQIHKTGNLQDFAERLYLIENK